MKKLKSSSNHKLIILAIIILLIISIGYALLTTTLSINGTANIASGSWLVYFTNVQVKDGSVTATQAPTTSGTSTTNLTWTVNLQTPGDFYEYNVDVKNDGTIDAMIGSLSNTSLDTNQAKYLDYSVTYSDGATIEQYDKLNSGETLTLKVRVEFKTDLNPEDLPGEGANVSLTYTSNYVQADSNAKMSKKLTEIVKNTDYGKSIDYSVTVNGTTLNNWQVFLNDGNNVYIILEENLPFDLMPNLGSPIEKILDSRGIGIYEIEYESGGEPDDITDKLVNTTIFDDFASGIGALSATGAPTLEQYESSYGQTIKSGDNLQGSMYINRRLFTRNICGRF